MEFSMTTTTSDEFEDTENTDEENTEEQTPEQRQAYAERIRQQQLDNAEEEARAGNAADPGQLNPAAEKEPHHVTVQEALDVAAFSEPPKDYVPMTGGHNLPSPIEAMQQQVRQAQALMDLTKEQQQGQTNVDNPGSTSTPPPSPDPAMPTPTTNPGSPPASTRNVATSSEVGPGPSTTGATSSTNPTPATTPTPSTTYGGTPPPTP
jgi:hypothetical protein